MDATSANVFKSVAKRFLAEQDGTADGMVDARAFKSALESEVKAMRGAIQPKMAGLNMSPPQWGNVALSDDAANTLRTLLTEHTRSTMSVDNLTLAVDLIAVKNGGAVNTPQAAEVLDKVVSDYMSNWPDYSVFDFNKLERIAKFAVEGKDVPLCTLNGQQLGLAEFYGKVAGAVTDSIDRGEIRHEWQAHRWGARAKVSVELLDVIAEKTAQGKGPVAMLQAKFPSAQIQVQATGLDGEHEQFLFRVMDGGTVKGVYNMGSDGTVAPYSGRKDPVLFSATINDDGSFNVDVPTANKVRKYPLQTPYSVGDSIDVAVWRPDATEVRTEGEKFETKAQIVEGKIVGFTANGDYRVAHKDGDGNEVENTLSMSEIKKRNHPHFFSETGSYLRDVEIDIKDDAPLKDFLDNAQPIIEKHLPTDGSMANWTANQIGKAQMECVKELMNYADENMKYPGSKTSSDPNNQKYWELDDLYRYPLGELLKIGKGMCRHQCIIEQLLLQRAGIDSRLASGAANTSSGNYRGLHLWAEVTLANNQRYLTDQTWKDAVIPLWDGAYDADARRLEIYNRTDDFDMHMVK